MKLLFYTTFCIFLLCPSITLACTRFQQNAGFMSSLDEFTVSKIAGFCDPVDRGAMRCTSKKLSLDLQKSRLDDLRHRLSKEETQIRRINFINNFRFHIADMQKLSGWIASHGAFSAFGLSVMLLIGDQGYKTALLYGSLTLLATPIISVLVPFLITLYKRKNIIEAARQCYYRHKNDLHADLAVQSTILNDGFSYAPVNFIDDLNAPARVPISYDEFTRRRHHNKILDNAFRQFVYSTIICEVSAQHGMNESTPFYKLIVSATQWINRKFLLWSIPS